MKTTAKLYDPLGFLLPFLLVARLIIQVLWRLGCGWDELVEDDIRKQWDKWLEGAKRLDTIIIKRQYVEFGDRRVTETQLHVFCDASEVAYGACAYLRYSFKSGEHECALIMSKSRLAPIKTVTLPKLEVDATRCGSRLARLVIQEIDLPIERIQYWSDSTLALQYIYNTKHRMKVYVANRVSEILEYTEPTAWSHVPGEINPADLLTRGVHSPEKLLESRWFKSAEFLEKNEEYWPGSKIDQLDESNSEIKHKPLFVGISLVDVETVNFERISSWLRLIRVAAWVIRFAENSTCSKDERNLDETLSLDELLSAEDLVLRDMQNSAFREEILSLSEGKSVAASNPLAKLSPFLDSKELLRVGGC